MIDFTKWNKEEISEYYKNHTLKDTASHFNISYSCLLKLFEHLNIEKKKRKPFTMSLEDREKRRLKLKEAWARKSKEEIDERTSKIKESSIKMYGVDDFTKSNLYIEKMRETNLKKYGVEHWTQTQEWKNFKHSFYKSLSEEEVKYINSKRSKTMNEKYGVDYYCLHPDSRNKNKRNSKPNLEFKELLEKNGFVVDEINNREISLGHYQFDFKINNILIEINPSTTHNCSFGLYKGKPLDKYYHFNKTKFALNNGYKCLNIFDWTDKNYIISLIKENKFNLIESSVKKHFYNLKTKEHIQNNNLKIEELTFSSNSKWDWVEIWDEGFEIINQ